MKNRVNELVSRRQLNEDCILVEKIHSTNKAQCVEYSVYNGTQEVYLGMVCNHPGCSYKEGIKVSDNYIAIYNETQDDIEVRCAYDLNEHKFYSSKDKHQVEAVKSILIKKNN